MQLCLVNLVSLNPPLNGGVSRIAHEVSCLLIEKARHNAQLNLIFVVNDQFVPSFVEWLGPTVAMAPFTVLPYSVEEPPDAVFGLLQPDLIISPLYGTMPFLATELFPQTPQIAQIPDTLPLDRPELFQPEDLAARKVLYRELEKIKLVVTISEFSRQRLLHHLQITPDKVKVVTLGANALPEAQPDNASPNSPKYVFYPANTWPHKRHDLLFRIMHEVWKQRPELKLYLTGGRSKGDTLIADLTAKYAPSPVNVHDLGFVTDAQLQRLYAGAEATLFVSAYEGFGMPVLEAMQNGCPVICAPTSSLPEIGGDAALYVDSEDPNEWAAALLDKLPAKRAGMREKGLQQAARFDWADKRTEWGALINECGIQLDPTPTQPQPARRQMQPFILLPAYQGQNRYFRHKVSGSIASLPNSDKRLMALLQQWRSISQASKTAPLQNVVGLGKVTRTLSRLQNLDNLWQISAELYETLIDQQDQLEALLKQLIDADSN